MEKSKQEEELFMKKCLSSKLQNESDLLNGRGITITEVKTIYQSLLNEHAENAREILDSIEENDYIRLNRLITRRKQIVIALNAIESVHEKDKVVQSNIRDQVADVLSSSAKITDDKGEELLLKITNSIDKVNLLAQNLMIKTINFSSETISKGNQLNHEAAKFLLNKASYGLSKLANIIRGES